MASVSSDDTDTVANEREYSILEQLTTIYGQLDASYCTLLALFGEAQKDDESTEASGAVPRIQHLISRMDHLAGDISTEVHRLKARLG
jgi:hypothetical protein